MTLSMSLSLPWMIWVLLVDIADRVAAADLLEFRNLDVINQLKNVIHTTQRMIVRKSKALVLMAETIRHYPVEFLLTSRTLYFGRAQAFRRSFLRQKPIETYNCVHCTMDVTMGRDMNEHNYHLASR